MDTLVHLQRHRKLTHDVQDVVSYLSRSDGALLGVSLQDIQHGLQLVQGAVLTLLTDELSTHRLENTQLIICLLLLFLFFAFFNYNYNPWFLFFPALFPLLLLTVH